MLQPHSIEARPRSVMPDTAIGLPSSVAPPPSRAAKVSPRIGIVDDADDGPAAGDEARWKCRNGAMPRAKFAVPSMGSTIHRRSSRTARALLADHAVLREGGLEPCRDEPLDLPVDGGDEVVPALEGEAVGRAVQVALAHHRAGLVRDGGRRRQRPIERGSILGHGRVPPTVHVSTGSYVTVRCRWEAARCDVAGLSRDVPVRARRRP